MVHFFAGLQMFYFCSYCLAMARKRFAIITFDPDYIDRLSWQGEGNSFAWIIWRGIAGYTYPKERGIINITLMDQLPAKPHPLIDDRKKSSLEK